MAKLPNPLNPWKTRTEAEDGALITLLFSALTLVLGIKADDTIIQLIAGAEVLLAIYWLRQSRSLPNE